MAINLRMVIVQRVYFEKKLVWKIQNTALQSAHTFHHKKSEMVH